MMLKRRYEPAETFSMAEDGFFGELYLPAHNAFPGKCLILFGGSAGKFLLTQLVAEQFVDAGMTVLALAYHGALGLPKFLVEQPVDVIEQAAEGGVKWDDPDVGIVWPAVDGEIRLSAKDGEHRGFKEQTYEFFERW